MNLVAKTIHEGDGMIVELGLSVLVFLNCYTLRSTDVGILFPESGSPSLREFSRLSSSIHDRQTSIRWGRVEYSAVHP